MIESQSTIAAWAGQTFGIASPLRAATRMNVECAELLAKMTIPGTLQSVIADECADILITLYVVAERSGMDLHAEVDKKMAVNRERKWKLDGSGCGQHVE